MIDVCEICSAPPKYVYMECGICEECWERMGYGAVASRTSVKEYNEADEKDKVKGDVSRGD